MEKKSRELSASDDSTFSNLLSRLSKELGIVEDGSERAVRRVYYDTFDWRLYLAGYALAVESEPAPGKSLLLKLGSGRSVFQVPQTVARFAWDNPPGPLRDFLAEHIGIRGLLPRVDLGIRVQSRSILDKRGRVVLKVDNESATAFSLQTGAKFPMKPRLRIEGVRGRVNAFKQALAVVEKTGIKEAESNVLAEALAAVGLTVEEYRPKPTLPLDPQMPANTAMSAILLHLLRIMELNLSGAAHNLDSEFLHDFRVAVRRTRSALGQIKEVFPKSSPGFFRDEFKWVGRITGPVRDLDVYLLKFPGYCRILPEAVRSDLEPLRDFLQRQQSKEQKKLAGHLHSSRLQKLLKAWREYLETCPDSAGLPSAAAIPICELAHDKIRKSYRKFLREGGEIGRDSPRQVLHRLRITGKKLRYLLEFFQTLYPTKPISRLVKEMKMMQDFLGEFQDLTVQQRQLREFGEAMKREKDIPGATLLAMGRLMEDMERRQRAMRLEFPGRFKAFASGDAGRLFKGIFSAAKTDG